MSKHEPPEILKKVEEAMTAIREKKKPLDLFKAAIEERRTKTVGGQP